MRALIFDLDGTLVDTVYAHVFAWQLALADAPLVLSKRCRYEISPDSHFIAAPHPEHANVWIVGGGSGHGFKHGPAMAERLTKHWHDDEPLPPRFALGAREYAASLRSAGSNR